MSTKSKILAVVAAVGLAALLAVPAFAVRGRHATPTAPDRTATSHSPEASPTATGSAAAEDRAVDDDNGDDPAGHDVGDDHGADDPAGHDVGDDHGADDPAGHDVGDDHGGHHDDPGGDDGHGGPGRSGSDDRDEA